MCGIIGYNGVKNAIPIVINGLKNLEYRGYDSSGIAYFFQDKVKIIKEKGPVGVGEAIATVDGKVACKGELTFALV